jgi:hypothetical protein
MFVDAERAQPRAGAELSERTLVVEHAPRLIDEEGPAVDRWDDPVVTNSTIGPGNTDRAAHPDAAATAVAVGAFTSESHCWWPVMSGWRKPSRSKGDSNGVAVAVAPPGAPCPYVVP